MVDYAGTLHRMQEALSKIVGDEWLSVRKSYLIIKPRTADEISGILKFANQTETPVTPLGGGTGRWSSTRPKAGGLLIDMTRMDGVIVLDEDAMTVTVEAGITFDKLESYLRDREYRILIFPESGKIATMGGHIETWGTSPFASSVNEDQATQIVALKVVIPVGEIVQTGSGALNTAAGNFGRRFFPSDITGLFIGAESAFGIIAEATLKLYKLPEAMITRLAGFKDLQSAVNTLIKIQHAQRSGGLSSIVEQRLFSKAPLINAIPRLKGKFRKATRIISIRGEGDGEDVERHMTKACDVAVQAGGSVLDDDVPEWWEGRYGLLSSGHSDNKGPSTMLVAMVPLAGCSEASNVVENFGVRHGMELIMRGYPFGGPIMLAHAVIPCKDATAEGKTHALNLGRRLMKELMDIGCVPHRVGTDFLPVVTKNLDPAYYQLVKRIKRLLDPNNIMYPDVIGSG